MRTCIVLMFLVISCYICTAQNKYPEFLFTIYFQDNSLNLDSIEIGYDVFTSEKLGCDSIYGESDYSNFTANHPITNFNVIGEDKTNPCVTDNRLVAKKTECGKFECSGFTCNGWFILNVYHIKLFPLKIWWTNRSDFKSNFCIQRSFIQVNLAGPLQGDYQWGVFMFKGHDTISVSETDAFFKLQDNFGQTYHSMNVQFIPGEVALNQAEVDQKIKYHYNRFDNKINIHDLTRSVESIALYDLSGKQLIQSRVSKFTYFSMELPYLPTGMYFLRLNNTNSVPVTKKIFIP